jgi:ATP-dependent helicase HrpA
MQVRLGRAVTDPRKDADKLAPLAPLWNAFLAKQATFADREGVRALRWAFEEMRVATFAPELKPLGGMTIAKIKTALDALR